MERRDFLILGTLSAISPSLNAYTPTPQYKAFKAVENTICAVQEHMFPEGTALPSAKKMQAIKFLSETLFHPTYDRDIRSFVIEGASALQKQEAHSFITYTSLEKEKALRHFEKTEQGYLWLSRIMILTIEALFSDPVYGSNIHEAGWRALQSFGGEPRPKSRYITL